MIIGIGVLCGGKEAGNGVHDRLRRLSWPWPLGMGRRGGGTINGDELNRSFAIKKDKLAVIFFALSLL
jgi:hypothetical protein